MSGEGSFCLQSYFCALFPGCENPGSLRAPFRLFSLSSGTPTGQIPGQNQPGKGVFTTVGQRLNECPLINPNGGAVL